MDKTTLLALENFLKDNLKSEKYIEVLLKNAEMVCSIEEEAVLAKRMADESPRDREFLTYIEEEIPELNTRFSTMRKIVRYFVIYSERPSSEIINELKRLDLSSYDNMNYLSGDYLQTVLYRRNTPEYGSLINVGQQSHEASHLFYSVFHILVKSLGIEASLSFIEQYVRLCILESFIEDSRHAVEIFMDGVVYCEENLDYPIEWNLSQAFLDKTNSTVSS